MADAHRSTPLICGTGLMALDVVANAARPDSPRFWAGGTCGNVLTILSFLGWRALPLGRLNTDLAGECVVRDMKQWKVDVRFVHLQPCARTPIIIEEIGQNRAGVPTHRFLWTCPCCGAYLPSYRPVPGRTIKALLPRLKAPGVYFFDRVSRGALELAREFSNAGAIVVFEPSASGDPKQFSEAVRLCHILKYSHQRVRSYRDLLADAKPWLQIETLGEDGLRFNCSLPLSSTRGWCRLPSFMVDDLKDTAGAGDWSTAGLIARLGSAGQAGLTTVTRDNVEEALRYGQALAAWNCRFEGPRGGMYQLTRERIEQDVSAILQGQSSGLAAVAELTHMDHSLLTVLCPSCETHSATLSPRSSVGARSTRGVLSRR